MEKLNWKQLMWTMIKAMILSYFITIVTLLILAFMLYRFSIDASYVHAGTIGAYVAATVAGGFFAGRCVSKRKYLWGLAAGALYFMTIVAVSVVLGEKGTQLMNIYFSLALLCLGGGMLGGMLV